MITPQEKQTAIGQMGNITDDSFSVRQITDVLLRIEALQKKPPATAPGEKLARDKQLAFLSKTMEKGLSAGFNKAAKLSISHPELSEKTYQKSTAFLKRYSEATAAKPAPRGWAAKGEDLVSTYQKYKSPASLLKFPSLLEGLGKAGPWIALNALVEGLKFFSATAVESLGHMKYLAQAGGIMNDSLATSITMTRALTTAWIDSEEAGKTLGSFMKEYGVLTNRLRDDTGAFNAELQKTEMVKVAANIADLTLMGKFFGLTAEQTGKVLGQLTSRFRLAPEQMKGAFNTITQLQMTTGLSIDAVTNIMTTAGDKLRWSSGNAATFLTVADSIGEFSNSVRKLYKDMSAGDVDIMMSKVSDLWKSMDPATYIGLKTSMTGTSPSTLAGLADQFTSFWKTGPVEGMRDVAQALFTQMNRAGTMSREQTLTLMAGTAPQFAEISKQFGAMAPKIIETLMDTTGKYSQALRSSGGDLTKYAQTLGRMGVGGAEMERLARTSEFLSDPMKVLVRLVTRILRIFEGMPLAMANISKSITDEAYYAQKFTEPEVGKGALKQ